MYCQQYMVTYFQQHLEQYIQSYCYVLLMLYNMVWYCQQFKFILLDSYNKRALIVLCIAGCIVPCIVGLLSVLSLYPALQPLPGPAESLAGFAAPHQLYRFQLLLVSSNADMAQQNHQMRFTFSNQAPRAGPADHR